MQLQVFFFKKEKCYVKKYVYENPPQEILLFPISEPLSKTSREF